MISSFFLPDDPNFLALSDEDRLAITTDPLVTETEPNTGIMFTNLSFLTHMIKSYGLSQKGVDFLLNNLVIGD